MSCAATESSVYYTRGTQALERGDLPTAITDLEEAVRLDPSLSRNHNNLASAYMAAGRIADGWPHVRKAVAIDPGNEHAVQNCRLYFVKMQQQSGMKEGDSLDQVREKLGGPDEEREERGRFWWRYCLVVLEFRDGRVVGVSDATYRR
jgi:tetratricopeptide (TPR) repeat protein